AAGAWAAAAARFPVGAMGGHARPAAADRDPVRPSLAGRTAGQPAGHPVVEPGGGAAGAGRNRAGGAARRLGRPGLAAGGLVLRPVLAPVPVAGGRPPGAVVAARGALVGAAAGPAGRLLAVAAARAAVQAAGAAAVPAAAVAGTRAVRARRVRTGGAGRGAGHLGTRPHRAPRGAVRRRACAARGLRRRRAGGGAGAARAGRAQAR